MKKRNVLVTIIFSALFVGSIYVYFLNINEIKDNKSKAETFKIQLETLKAENEALIKTNSELMKANLNISEKVNSFKDNSN